MGKTPGITVIHEWKKNEALTPFFPEYDKVYSYYKDAIKNQWKRHLVV